MTKAEQPVNPNSIAPLKNVAELLALVDMLESMEDTNRRMGLFSGFSGYGKSMACTYIRNKRDAAYVQVPSYWSKKDCAEKLLHEVGGQVKRQTFSKTMDDLIERLVVSPRPLLIDEADKLVDKGMIELVRDIQDFAQCPVILVGEELLPQKIKAIERVDGRIRGRVLAQPCDMADARTLARFKCRGLELADDLLAATVAKTGGNAGLITSNLLEFRQYALKNVLTKLDLDSYGGSYFTGDALVRQRRA